MHPIEAPPTEPAFIDSSGIHALVGLGCALGDELRAPIRCPVGLL